MERMFNTLAIAALAAVLSLVQLLIATLLPIVGSFFFIGLISLLSSINRWLGVATLKDVNDSWPVPTAAGWGVSVVFLYLAWLSVISVWLKIKEESILWVFRDKYLAMHFVKSVVFVFVGMLLLPILPIAVSLFV